MTWGVRGAIVGVQLDDRYYRPLLSEVLLGSWSSIEALVVGDQLV